MFIEPNIPPFIGTDELQRVYLVDTPGIGATTTQHREGLTALYLQSSSAFVYFTKHGETEETKNQDDYRAIAKKDKCKIFLVCIIKELLLNSSLL